MARGERLATRMLFFFPHLEANGQQAVRSTSQPEMHHGVCQMKAREVTWPANVIGSHNRRSLRRSRRIPVGAAEPVDPGAVRGELKGFDGPQFHLWRLRHDQ